MRPIRCSAAPTGARFSMDWRGRCDDVPRCPLDRGPPASRASFACTDGVRRRFASPRARMRASRPRSLHKMTGSDITPELAAEHGLSADEFARACAILGHTPNMTELGIFSVMWSEHCSYKSSKVWLRTLPTSGPCVICGPGENAGVVDIGDGDAVVF